MSVPTVTDDKNYYIYNQYGDNTWSRSDRSVLSPQSSQQFRGFHQLFLGTDVPSISPAIRNITTPVLCAPIIGFGYPPVIIGEGKAIITQTVRGHDLFIIVDVLNYNRYYDRYSQRVSLSPDEQYQDLLRIILAASGKARRINLIMPYLYEGRQYRRGTRESLDCAAMLKELFALGIKSILTFDAHDPRIINAVPTENVENLTAAYQIIESISDRSGLKV